MIGIYTMSMLKDLVIIFCRLYGVQYSDEVQYGLIFDTNYQLLLLQQLLFWYY